MKNPISTKINARKTLFTKIWIGFVAILLFIAGSWFTGNRLQGDITQTDSKTDPFYIPDYTASVWDSGSIEVISSAWLNNLSGVSFTLVYNANKVTIPDNSVEGPDGAYDFIQSQNVAEWRLKVMGAGGNKNGFTLNAGDAILTITDLELVSSLAEGEVLLFSVEDFEYVTSVDGELESHKDDTVTAWQITIGSAGTLELLSATSVDETSVKLYFSDYLSEIWSFSFDNNLTQISAEIDSDNGKALLITTSTQEQGTLYTITASGTQGNVQGSLASDKNTAYFTGKNSITTESDFDLASATAYSASGITLTFSHDILDGSVYAQAFSIMETQGWTGYLTLEDVSLSGSDAEQVNLILTGSVLLESDKNYLVEISKQGLSSDIRRASDNLTLRQNLETFPGFSTGSTVNQFSVDSVEAIGLRQIEVKFSENLSALSVDMGDFTVSGSSVTNLTIPYSGSYSHALVEIDQDMEAGTYYILQVNDTNGLTAYSGNSLSTSDSKVFVGYGTTEDRSDLALNSVKVKSSTKLELEFSSEPSASTITPVNFEVIPDLTITDAQLDGTTVTLTTAVQSPDTLYTVVALADKIKNSQEILISSDNTATFTWYAENLPVINSVDPDSFVNNVENTLTLLGKNFESWTKVYLNTQKLSATIQSTEITATLPVDFIAGTYELELERPNGEKIKWEGDLIVEDPPESITILSEESQAVPDQIANDWTEQSVLWVRVSDPKGVSDIDQVRIDLTSIGGSPDVEMTAGSIVDNRRYYTTTVTVSSKIQSGTYTFSVYAQNKAGDRDYGEVTLSVGSYVPEIKSAYSVPGQVSPGGGEEVYFYAEIEDKDGAHTISSVTLDLSAVDGAPLSMTPVDSGTGSNLQVYQTTTPYSLPSHKRDGSYQLSVRATDQTNQSAELEFSLYTSVSATKPFIDEDRVEVISQYWTNIPKDGETSFIVEAYVEDPDGIADIATVEIDLHEIGLSTMTMTTTATTGVGAMYSTEPIVVSESAYIGVKQLNIYARDTSGGEGEAGVQINVKKIEDFGNAPEIANGNPSRTVPLRAQNDESTRMTLYAFVSDKDDDIDYVTIDLTGVARYVGGSGSGSQTNGYYEYQSEETFNPCKDNSDSVMCMFPGVSEWNGRWYVLPDVVILKEATPKVEPYQVWVTAVDKTGKISDVTGRVPPKGYININVTDERMSTQEVSFPTLRLAAATASNEVEVMFTNPIVTSELKSSGRDFKITEKDNTSAQLSVSKAVVNSEGTIITLTTGDQEPGMDYAVVVDPTDLGIKDNQVSNTLGHFKGFIQEDIPPQIESVKATSSYLVEIQLKKDCGHIKDYKEEKDCGPIKPTSVNSTGSDFEIYTAGADVKYLEIQRAELTDQYTIVLTTDLQISNQTYRVSMKNIESATGRVVKHPGITREFTGFDAGSLHGAAAYKSDFNGDNQVNFSDFTGLSANYGQTVDDSNAVYDLNDDGVIDFTDFTIFSTLYGTSWDGEVSAENSETQSGSESTEASSTWTTQAYNPVETTSEVPY